MSQLGRVNTAHVNSRGTSIFPRPNARSARVIGQRKMKIAAKANDPPDVPKDRSGPQGGREWLQSILSRFGPVKEKNSNTTVLDFEKPLVELDNRIKEVCSDRCF